MTKQLNTSMITRACMRLLHCLLLVAMLLVFSQRTAIFASEPPVKPLTKEVVLQALKLLNGAAPNEAFISRIQKRGTDFALSPAEEVEWMRTYGVTQRFIDVLRAFYHPVPPPPVLTGPPLTKQDVLAALKAGTAQAGIEEMVKARSVTAGISEADLNDIESAGALPSLVHAIRERLPPPPRSTTTPIEAAPPAAVQPQSRDMRATLVFYMPCATSFKSAKSRVDIFADRLLLARLSCGRYFYGMAVPASFTICVSRGDCSMGNVSAGATYYFRVSKPRKYSVELVPDTTGSAEMKSQSAEPLEQRWLVASAVTSTSFDDPPKSAIVHSDEPPRRKKRSRRSQAS